MSATINTIDAGVLSVAYVEYGPASGRPVWATDSLTTRTPTTALRQSWRGWGAGDRALSARLWADPVSRGRDAALGRTGGAGRGSAGAHGRAKVDRAVLGGYDWGGRAACVVAALWPERVARWCRSTATTSRTSPKRWSRRARPRKRRSGINITSTASADGAGLTRTGARSPPAVAHVVAGLGVRRRDL